MTQMIICCDLDDTLIPNAHRYHAPAWRCGLIITNALGVSTPSPMEILQFQLKVDQEAVVRQGYGTDRFPNSWITTYRQLAEKAGITAKSKVEERLFNTASRFKYGPFRAFKGVKRVLKRLKKRGHSLHLITVGDVALQQRKIDQSNLASYFEGIHIVTKDKKPAMRAVVEDSSDPSFMVGDSKRYDIKPAQELGMKGIWVPSSTWSFEGDESIKPEFTIDSFTKLPQLCRKLIK